MLRSFFCPRVCAVHSREFCFAGVGAFAILHKLVAKHLLSLLHEERIVRRRLANKLTWHLPAHRLQQLQDRAESLRRRIVLEWQAVVKDMADLLRRTLPLAHSLSFLCAECCIACSFSFNFSVLVMSRIGSASMTIGTRWSSTRRCMIRRRVGARTADMMALFPWGELVKLLEERVSDNDRHCCCVPAPCVLTYSTLWSCRRAHTIRRSCAERWPVSAPRPLPSRSSGRAKRTAAKCAATPTA